MKKERNTPNLFESGQSLEKNAPLAERLRPQKLEEVVGQEKILGERGALRVLIQKDQVPSMIFWGPPGSGKTTLAGLIAHYSQAKFIAISAVLSGVQDLRSAVQEAKEAMAYHNKKTILFIDEIHRFNKAQQDALLPHIENGTLILIGATTENPSFSVIAPLLSRCRVFVLETLTEDNLRTLLEKGIATLNTIISDEAREFLISWADGDARRLLNSLEIAANLKVDIAAPIELEQATQATQHKALSYDKTGEAHYNIISAFIKSMRASDPDAAVYYLARMYEAGEDPLFLARRMVIFASEDIGLADPQALPLAMAAMQSYDFVGQAEGWIPLSHAAIYLALAPKNNRSYRAYQNAKAEIENSGSLPVPLHLRNAPTALMKKLDYGKNYKYAHSDPEGSKNMTCLPDKLRGKKFLER